MYDPRHENHGETPAYNSEKLHEIDDNAGLRSWRSRVQIPAGPSPNLTSPGNRRENANFEESTVEVYATSVRSTALKSAYNGGTGYAEPRESVHTKNGEKLIRTKEDILPLVAKYYIQRVRGVAYIYARLKSGERRLVGRFDEVVDYYVRNVPTVYMRILGVEQGDKAQPPPPPANVLPPGLQGFVEAFRLWLRE